MRNCISGEIPKVDAVRDLSGSNPEEVRKIHEETVDTLKKNRVFREETIGGYVVAGIDGVELFSSTKKSCPDCLTWKNRTGETEFFPSECGLYDGRKSAACDTWPGNAKAKRRSGKG